MVQGNPWVDWEADTREGADNSEPKKSEESCEEVGRGSNQQDYANGKIDVSGPSSFEICRAQSRRLA